MKKYKFVIVLTNTENTFIGNSYFLEMVEMCVSGYALRFVDNRNYTYAHKIHNSIYFGTTMYYEKI